MCRYTTRSYTRAVRGMVDETDWLRSSVNGRIYRAFAFGMFTGLTLITIIVLWAYS